MKNYMSKQNLMYGAVALVSVIFLVQLKNKNLSCSSCESK